MVVPFQQRSVGSGDWAWPVCWQRCWYRGLDELCTLKCSGVSNRQRNPRVRKCTKGMYAKWNEKVLMRYRGGRLGCLYVSVEKRMTQYPPLLRDQSRSRYPFGTHQFSFNGRDRENAGLGIMYKSIVPCDHRSRKNAMGSKGRMSEQFVSCGKVKGLVINQFQRSCLQLTPMGVVRFENTLKISTDPRDGATCPNHSF